MRHPEWFPHGKWLMSPVSFFCLRQKWRNRFPPCAQCGLENKVRYCPMISIHLQNLCCNSAWMVISRFVQITYSFTVETTCSCKKCSCIWWCRISSSLWAKGLRCDLFLKPHKCFESYLVHFKIWPLRRTNKWNHSFSSVQSAKSYLQSWILMLGFCVWENT